jgi:TetR/AcrR family transcriptional regulator, cholesterol catabolism regulator
MTSSEKPPRNSRKALARKANGSESRGNAPQGGRSRRQQVLDSAIEIFYERGFSDTSVEDVASAAGLLKGSLYYYIDSKQDLLYKIIEDVHEAVQRIFDETTSDTSVPPLERLARFARRQIEYNARHVKTISVYYHDYERLEGQLLAEVRSRRRQHERAVLTLLDEAKAEGSIAESLDTKLAASCVFAVIIWPYTWYRSNRPGPAELAAFCTSFILGGILGAPAQLEVLAQQGT